METEKNEVGEGAAGVSGGGMRVEKASAESEEAEGTEKTEARKRSGSGGGRESEERLEEEGVSFGEILRALRRSRVRTEI